MSPQSNPLREDLENVLNLTGDLWEELRGKKLFLTGGTGFFGCWILESFLYANEKLNLNASTAVLTRNPAAFREKAPHLAQNPAVDFIAGDIASFEFPTERFDFVIHAATDVYNQVSPLKTIDTTIEGTRRVLDFAVRCGAKKFLLTSSGAVYGTQPPALSRVDEDYQGAPNPVSARSAYGEGKRVSELLCAIYAAENDLEIKIARCFAFVGPYLQLDGHLAIGNFIRDAINGDPIRISGDGSPVRSYLYASDLAVWLWTILFRGKSRRPYNVGSERDISLADLAEKVARAAEKPVEVQIAQKQAENSLPARYVPSTRRALEDLGLRATVDLEAAVEKTVAYFGKSRRQS